MPDLNTLTPEQLAQSLVGDGVIVSNVTYTGANVASGDFSGGIADGIGIEEGVILTSGSVANAASPNDADGTGTSNNTAGDADLDAISAAATQDAAILEFDFIPQSNSISFNYVFASEEYNEYANGSYNDSFGFFLDGQNIALLPGTTTPVAINDVNNVDNTAFFNNNDPSDLGSPTPFATEYDGFTTVLNAQADVEPGTTHTIRLAIADAGDTAFDSAVFLEEGSFVGQTTATNDAATTDADTAVDIDVLSNDIDPEGDPLSIDSFDFVSTKGGTISLNDNGTPGDLTDDLLNYTPANGFSGGDQFTYTVTDGTNTDLAYVSVNVGSGDIVGTPGGDGFLNGTDDNNSITGLQGRDFLTGGAGNDKFIYTSMVDAGDIIEDFAVGEDQIVLTDVLAGFGYTGSNPIADGYVSFGASDPDTYVQIDPDGTGPGKARNFILVENVISGDLNNANNFVF